MNLLGKETSYRQMARLADLKLHNDNSKRMFGRDITNLQRKSKKNASIYEKVPAAKLETKARSHSVYGRKEKVSPRKSIDAIHEYKQDIIDFMVELQKTEAKEDQLDISIKMRQILIDWIVDVHDSFELKEQTLHLALSYLSDYSGLCQISKEEYQLVGITCLWIASKYEEIYPPRTKNYVEVTADTYTLKDLKAMEGNIIKALNFELNRTTTLQLLEAVKADIPEKHISFCKYVLELSLFQGVAKTYSPYAMVVGALSLADSVFKTKSELKLQCTEEPPRE